MFGHLLKDAQKDSIADVEIAIFALRKDELLLLEEPYFNQQNFYHLPKGKIKKDETISQALHRVLMEETLLAVSEVEKFLAYQDTETDAGKKRSFYFVVRVVDPEEIQAKKYHSYAWAVPTEAVGYPIKDELREMLDLYMKS
ncbi:hypothetical protein COB11_04875 [Candidatus Aerophobetes bacterium]|uniref:Nudix hydrolase domain-containing protein n=1 Tax=Aerophobetes bacterium TaxID=2030807 RepID=A0A2A4YFU7_UNCAE|nr:MAG: hypothetical protein COB11_04875 [Candidatus Aerophobetes bacterium]